jgi:hypothetical protein
MAGDSARDLESEDSRLLDQELLTQETFVSVPGLLIHISVHRGLLNVI